MGRTLHLFIVSLLVETTMSQAPAPVVTLVGSNASFSFRISHPTSNIIQLNNMNDIAMIIIKGTTIELTDMYKYRVLFTGSVSDRNISFVLRNVTVMDAGVYTATGGGLLGQQKLIVKASPSKPQIVGVTDAVSGRNYSLRCSAVSNSAPLNHSLIMMSKWEFRRNGQPFMPGVRYIMLGTNLTITGISYEEDNGVNLTCIAYEDLEAKSEESAGLLINVKYGPHNIRITGNPMVNEEGRLTLNCSGDCNPICDTYQWWKGSQSTLISSSPFLVIDNVRRDQDGVYTCTVNNSAISNSSEVQTTVTVNYGPDAPITQDPNTTLYKYKEKTSIPNITCLANCRPPCYYQWIGPVGTILSSVLSLGTLDRSERGSYWCTATNPRTSAYGNGSTIQVYVIYGPDVPHLSPNTTVYTRPEGETVPDINCSADCFPVCTQVWIKGATAVPGTNKGTLTLGQVYRGNAGNYTCCSNNTESKAIGYITIQLDMQYPPVLKTKATNTSKGGIVVINCSASGVPNIYTFYKWTHIAPDENRTIVRELEQTKLSGSEVSLTIKGATYQDSGFYVCKASNGITHYSTKQLIMEDMVSIWITDQPIITSKTRYFDAEKGKSGHMYIEFYSGLSQPVVTWYRVKNLTMELVQNSSDLRIYLLPVAVELQYQQKTVRLPGYNASLEVSNVDLEHFTSYKVEINISFADQVNETLELKPRGPPETPTNFSVLQKSVTAHSLQLTWRAEFHGGAPQTCIIQYKVAGETNWLNKSLLIGLVQHVTLNTTINFLKEGTTYEFRIYSENLFNRSRISPTINETTKTVEKDELVNPDGSSVVIGAATGSALVLVVAVVVVGFFFYKRRQSTKSPEEDGFQVEKSSHDRHESGLAVNPVYDSSGHLPVSSISGGATGVEYAAVVKPKTKIGKMEDPSKLYAQVDKTNKKRKKEDIYENVTLVERGAVKKETLYPNLGDLRANENVNANAAEEAPNDSLAKKDGFLYADLMLDSPTTKNGKCVIRGLENRTEYAEIAYGKRGEPLPDIDEKNESNVAKD